MRRQRDEPIEVKTAAQLALMREAGRITAAALAAVIAAAVPGVSTADLDLLAEQVIRSAGALPSFKGYHGYPATICTSVNEQVVHGIPGPEQVLAAGDVLSVDCGAVVRGWHGDSAVTVIVGGDGACAGLAGMAGPALAGGTGLAGVAAPAMAVDGQDGGTEAPGWRRKGSQGSRDVAASAGAGGLLRACEGALWAGIARAVPGGRLTDISHAVEQAARAAGRYGLVREYTGHAIGTRMHMDPAVPNHGAPGRGPELLPGMTLAIEPMLTLGRPQTRVLADDWTVVTVDGSWAAHFEHTVAVTDDGPVVLTALDDQPGQAGSGLRGPELGWPALAAGRTQAAGVLHGL